MLKLAGIITHKIGNTVTHSSNTIEGLKNALNMIKLENKQLLTET